MDAKNTIFYRIKNVEFRTKKRAFVGSISVLISRNLLLKASFARSLGKHALSKTICRDWFRRFQNNDFDVNDKEGFGQPKFEDRELEALL